MMHSDIMALQKDINNSNFDQIARLEDELKELKQLIANNSDGRRHQAAVALLTRKLDDLKREKAHTGDVFQIEKSVKELENEVLNVKIPVCKHPLDFFEELRQKVVQCKGLLDKHKDNCSAINNLRKDVKDVKKKIESLDKDNKIALAWLGTSTTLTAASIGVAFIPGAGLPIAAGMNVVPYFGKLAHRLAESSNRREMFTQNDS